MKKPKLKNKRRRKNSRAQKQLADATTFEKITARIYEMLKPVPNCIVTHNDKIRTKDGERLRQIDVSIKANLYGHDILIIVNTKNQKSRVTVKQVDELYGAMCDVGATNGVLICNIGFTSGAKGRAKSLGIDLCGVHDAETKDWKLNLKLPIIWEEIVPVVETSGRIYLTAGMQLNKDCIFTISGVNILEKFTNEWNLGKISLDKDKQLYEFDIENPTIKILQGEEVAVQDLNVSITLERTFYFGYFHELPTAKALVNSSTNKANCVIPFSDVQNVDKNRLVKLNSLEEAPVPISEHLRILTLPKVSSNNLNIKWKIQGPI